MCKKLLTILICSISLFAQTQTFIKEYTYRMSHDDSKNSARSKAQEQLRAELLKEIGTFVQTNSSIRRFNDNSNVQEIYEKAINITTEGKILMKILAEKFNSDNDTYWLKAEMQVDVGEINKYLDKKQKEEAEKRALQIEQEKAFAQEAQARAERERVEAEAAKARLQKEQAEAEIARARATKEMLDYEQKQAEKAKAETERLRAQTEKEIAASELAIAKKERKKAERKRENDDLGELYDQTFWLGINFQRFNNSHKSESGEHLLYDYSRNIVKVNSFNLEFGGIIRNGFTANIIFNCGKGNLGGGGFLGKTAFINEIIGLKFGCDLGFWRINTQSLDEKDGVNFGRVHENFMFGAPSIDILGLFILEDAEFFVSLGFKSLLGYYKEFDMADYPYKGNWNSGATPRKTHFGAMYSWKFGFGFIF